MPKQGNKEETYVARFGREVADFSVFFKRRPLVVVITVPVLMTLVVIWHWPHWKPPQEEDARSTPGGALNVQLSSSRESISNAFPPDVETSRVDALDLRKRAEKLRCKDLRRPLWLSAETPFSSAQDQLDNGDIATAMDGFNRAAQIFAECIRELEQSPAILKRN